MQRSKDEIMSNVSSKLPFHMDVPMLVEQQEITHNSSALTPDAVWKI